MSRGTAPALWSRHSMEWWQERGSDPTFPYYFRVAAFAYGLHGVNGHAPLKHGALSLMLGTVDPETGKPVPYRNTARAVAVAVDRGLLAPESGARCLVVPPAAIKQGRPWEWPTCRVHGHTKPQNGSLSESLSGHPAALSESFTRHPDSLSEPLPARTLLHSASAHVASPLGSEAAS